MKYLLILTVSIFFLPASFSQTCNKLQMAYEYHNLTTHDSTSPVIDVQDRNCITAYYQGDPLPANCIPNDAGSRPEGLHAYYDLDGNGDVKGLSNHIQPADMTPISLLVFAPSDAEKLDRVNRAFHHVNRQYTRRRCDFTLPTICNAQKIMIDLHDFNRDGILNAADKLCLDKVILTGGGRAFHESNPGCARTDDPLKNYDVNNRGLANSAYSSMDSFLLQAAIQGSKTAYELPQVKIITDMFGCSQTAPAGPEPMTIRVTDNQDIYNIRVGRKLSIRLVHTGDAARNVTVHPVTSHPSMTFAPVPYYDGLHEFQFTPTASGVFVVDFRVSQPSALAITKRVTINATNSTPSGAPPVFTAPDEGRTYIFYATEGRHNGGISPSVTGTDADGGNTVTVEAVGLPENSYVYDQNLPPAIHGPEHFSWPLSFFRTKENVGTHNVQLIARDEGENIAVRNITFVVLDWFENITNPNAGNEEYKLSYFNESGYEGEDVAGTYAVGETIRMNFEYPAPPAAQGKKWEFRKVSSFSQVFPRTCTNPPDLTFTRHPTNENMAELSFTPTAAGVVEVCIDAYLFKQDVATFMYEQKEHRLRFNVGGVDTPLQLALEPNLSDFVVAPGQLLKIKMTPSGGNPAYSYGYDITNNPSGMVSNRYLTNEGGSHYFNFSTDATSGKIHLNLKVGDQNFPASQAVVPITISVFSLALTDPSARTMRSTESLAIPLTIRGGEGDLLNFTYNAVNLDPSLIPGWTWSVTGGSSPQLNFTPKSDEDYSINNTFAIEITVTDEGGNTATAMANIEISNIVVCGVGQWQVNETLCCNNNQIEFPAGSGTCMDSTQTMALIDKQDFMSDQGSAGFPSLCQVQVDTGTNYVKTKMDISSEIKFVENSLSSDYFQHTCRKLAGFYNHYTEYHQEGGDLNTGITVNDPVFDDRVDEQKKSPETSSNDQSSPEGEHRGT